MEEEVFPYRGLGADQLEELDEERRLAYVAITRARERLVVTYTGQRMLFGQTRYLAPSRFLADIPPETVKMEGRLTSPSGYEGGAVRSRPVSEPSNLASGRRVVDHDFFDDVPSDDFGVALERGARVRHRRFGEGLVERVELDGEPTIVARFPGFGVRKVRARFLEPA